MIGQALGWNFDHEPGITTIDGVITEWPSVLGEEPTEAEILVILEEYQAFKAWDDVRVLQNQMFSTDSKISARIARYKLQKDHTGQSTKESSAKYQELLQYFQDIRDSDETTYATPQEALDALNALALNEPEE